MFRRIVSSAAVAGLASGLLLTAMQLVLLTPLIRRAERLEVGGHGDAPPLFATAGASIALAIGLALLLAAAMTLHGRSGWRNGLLWGVAGYAVFFVAPSLGLPPELPGAEAAGLHERQIWWVATVALSAAGLALAALSPHVALKGLGVLLIAAPHLAGAPQASGAAGTVPAELAAEFIRAAYAANAIFWLALGALLGHLLRGGAGIMIASGEA